MAVAKSPADGYTLIMGTVNSHGINSAIVKNLPYDAIRDFSPITIIGNTPNVLAVNPSVPAKNLAELLALARAKPGTLNFGSTSPGGSPHMSGELLKTMANIDIAHIPYKGAGPMLIDLIGGQIQMGFDNMPSSIGHITLGQVARDRSDHGEALAGRARCPDHGRERLARLRGVGLVRPARARRHAQGRHRHPLCPILPPSSSSAAPTSSCSISAPSPVEIRPTLMRARSRPMWRSGRRWWR